PSIPLKIIRDDLSFTLIESTGKKCNYLNDVVEKLALFCVQVKNIRAEDGARDKNLREKFDVSCARAVARLNTLCEYCLPFVRVGGRFIAYKSDAAEELKEAERAIKLLGGEIESVTDYELPESFGKRNIICIRKIKSTPENYPRGQGKERKNPL
ncbi:MAG: 16S rRNA (guanine(527)-N(7))-methyltransferase RsmG, partial [Clostridia bacterium]|nr:16S rRNA (guanine(527)-N(7))-methyltransferase RsmG [Clostridia bacterium]